MTRFLKRLTGVLKRLTHFLKTTLNGSEASSKLRHSPRLYTLHFTPSTRKIAPKCDFSCISQKKVVPLPSKVQRRGLEGGRCPLSESQMLTQRPQSRLSRHIKKAFITLCSDSLESRKFQYIQDLATIDVLRDIELSLLCLL